MYCSNCGKEISPCADMCIYCGCAVKKLQNDDPSFLLGSAACCFPVVGIILYFLWKDEKPRSSNLVCKCALAGFIIPFIIYILFAAIAIFTY